jgi:hypothetical protein
VTDSASGDSIYFHDWGSTVTGSSDPEHEEDWNFAPGEEGIGHAVTGVGYFRNIDPDNGGPLPYGDYIVVHDNWYDTPENVAICWNNWLAAISADPRFAVAVAEPVDLEPYFDWGAISSYSGLVPPGFMGIWSPSHTTNLYFPSDSLAPFTSSPKAWLDPGDHVLTRYAPSHVRIDSCPVKDAIITVPDRFDRPCSVLVEIPRANLIDEATDSNVIQISSSETKCITIGEYTELVVFLANCDGGVTRPEWPDTSQHLGVIINYADSTVDSLIFADIHPAARLDITDPNWPPSWIFVYGNEVLVSAPPYFDSPFGFDEYHSEVWHWYTLLPDPDVLVDSLVFIGMQPVEPNNEIYILALSYQGGASSGIYGEDEAPSHLGRARLFQNRPNPFCLTTGIRYALSRDCWVRLEIYNVLGERVAVLVDGQEKAGYRTATLDAGSLSSGIYFCRLNAGHQIETMKMILLK